MIRKKTTKLLTRNEHKLTVWGSWGNVESVDLFFQNFLFSKVMTWLNSICRKFHFSFYFKSLPNLLRYRPKITVLNGYCILTNKKTRANKKDMLPSHVLKYNIFSWSIKNLKSYCLLANFIHSIVWHLWKQEIILH